MEINRSAFYHPAQLYFKFLYCFRVYREAKGAVVLAEPSVPAAKAGQYMGSAFGPDGVKVKMVYLKELSSLTPSNHTVCILILEAIIRRPYFVNWFWKM